MRRVRALAALLVLELRHLRRHRGRSALVALLVAAPVAAVVGGSTIVATTQPTLGERCSQYLGSAALRVEVADAHAWPALEAALPSDARRVPLLLGRDQLSSGGRHTTAAILALDPQALDDGGLAAGLLRLTQGRAPAQSGEVALSPAVLGALGLERTGDPGSRDADRLRDASGSALVVTGVVCAPENLDQALALRVPEDAGPAMSRALLVDLPAAEEAALAGRLAALGGRVTRRAEVSGPDAFEAVVVFVVGGLGAFEAALIVGAAFAVSLRRRQREIGLLGACGASPASICAALALSAGVLALIGIALGVLAGLGAARAVHPFLDGWNGRWNGPLELSWPPLAGAMILGLAVALGAVLLPARRAVLLPTRIALAARRPPAGPARGWGAAGAAGLASGAAVILWATGQAGLAATVAVLGGGILALLGLGALSPWLLGMLARAAAPLPLALRLALRDAGRFRARNGPVVTAVMAGMAVSVLLAALSGSIEAALAQRDAGGARAAVPRDDLFLLAVRCACFVTGLVVVFVAVALAAAESVQDRALLHSLGAAPGSQRRLLAARAGVLALLGAALAVPAGLLPGYGLVTVADVELAFRPRWTELAWGLLGLPAVAAAGTWVWALLAGAGRPAAMPGR